MRLDNTLLDIDTLLIELDKEIPVSKSAHKSQPNALEILQRKIKEHYFNDKKMSNEDALNKINTHAFDDFPRLKYVLHEIFKGNQNIQIPEELKDWEPTVSFESLNEKYGYFDTDLSDLFARLAIACRKMTAIIERQANDDEMAYKLMALFYEPNKTNDENFQWISTKFDSLISKKQDKSITHPYHDAFVTILHHFPIFRNVKELQSWQNFIAKEGFNSLAIFAQCAHLQPAFEKIKEAQDFLLKQKYPRANEHPMLAKLCKKLLIDNSGFEAGLNEVKTGWPKKETDNLPIVDIADETGQYFWVKLPPQDMRALYLGNLIPGCCQHIGGHSEQCVKDGIALSDNGFYVLLKAKKEGSNEPRIINNEVNDKHYDIVAQSYAWKSNNGNLCLDSIEWNPHRVKTNIIQDLMSKFSETVFEEHPSIKHITAGAGGQTPRGIYPPCVFYETMKQGYMYGDSQRQFTIASNITDAELTALKERLKPYSKVFQYTVLYIAPYFKSISELPDELLSVNSNLITEIPQLVTRINLPPMLTIDDFKKISFEEFQQMNAFEQQKVSTVCKIFNCQHGEELIRWIPSIPSHERLWALQQHDNQRNVLLHESATNPDSLRIIFENLSPEEHLHLLTIKNTNGETILFKAIDNPESFKMILELYPLEQRLEAVKVKYSNGNSLLYAAATKPELLKMILELIPPEQRLEAVNEKSSNGYLLLFSVIYKPELFKIILELLPPLQRLEAVNVKNSYGGSLLQDAISRPESLKIILELYPPDERFEVIKDDEFTDSLLIKAAATNPRSLNMILELISPEQRLEAIKVKNSNGDSLLFAATTYTESFKILLDLIPSEKLLETVKVKNSYGNSLLFKAASKPELFTLILERYPTEQRLAALGEITCLEKTLLGRICTNFPMTYQLLLNALPEEIALVFKERENNLGSNPNEVLACALSIEQFMKDMQELAPPESIKAFVQALIKNEDIQSAKDDLFRTDSSPSFFKSNNLDAIHQCIEKLDTFWLTRIQASQPDPTQPKIRK